MNAQNAYHKTPLDLVEGPWRFFSRHDSNYTCGTYHSPSEELSLVVPSGDSLDVELTQSYSSALKEYVDLEYAPNKTRVGFVYLLTSVGAQRAKNMPRIQPAPVLLCPMVAESLSQSTTHPDPYIVTLRQTFSEKILASIHSCEKSISVLCSSDLDNTSNAVALAKNAQKLKMLRKAGSRILCLDGGGLRGLMQAEILAQIQAATGRKITELFDWIVGTSIGGVIALWLVYGEWSTVK